MTTAQLYNRLLRCSGAPTTHTVARSPVASAISVRADTAPSRRALCPNRSAHVYPVTLSSGKTNMSAWRADASSSAEIIAAAFAAGSPSRTVGVHEATLAYPYPFI